jgi:hypothetical protein
VVAEVYIHEEAIKPLAASFAGKSPHRVAAVAGPGNFACGCQATGRLIRVTPVLPPTQCTLVYCEVSVSSQHPLSGED